jgi:UDP-N-acetyl-D-mannosaminuronic acid dehydrogenase
MGLSGDVEHPDRLVPSLTMSNLDLDVVVLGGGGHVGLPLSLAFAAAGLRVGVYDTNRATLDRIGRGEMPFREGGAEDLLRDLLPTGRLELSDDPAAVGRADVLVIVIGTPVDEFLGPSMTLFEKTVEQVAPHLRDRALVVLRSTVYPGTTGYVAQAFTDRGCRVEVAFCPERIAEASAPTTRPSATGRRRCSPASVVRSSEPPRRKPSSRSSSRTRGGT